MINMDKEVIVLPTSYSNKLYSFNSTGDVIIPDSKEDVADILFVDCIPTIDESMVNSGQITITGNAEFNIIYASDTDYQDVVRISTTIPFKSSFEVPSVNSDSIISISLLPDDIESEILNGRKISLNAKIGVNIASFNSSPIEYAKSINSDDNIQTLTTSKTVCTFIGNDKVNTNVRDTVMLPTSLPNIDNIIKYEAKIINEEDVVSDDKIIFKGDLFIKIYYCSENEDNLTVFDSTIPFSNFANINNITSDSKTNIKSCINNISLKILPDSDELMRVIEFDAQITTNACAFNSERLELINDLYCTQKTLIPQINNIHYTVINNVPNEDINFRGVINIQENETVSVISTFGRIKNIFIDNTENKFILKGNVEVTIIYRVPSNNSLHSTSTNIPLEHLISSNLNTITSAYIINIDSTQNELGKFDIKVNLSFSGEEIKSENIELLTDIAESDEVPEKKSSLTIYYAKPGDTYWKIAKKFNTTLEKLKELNNLNDMDKLSIGTPVIV